MSCKLEYGFRPTIGAALALLATASLALPAAAQTLDYGTLEKTFGEPVTTSATGSPQRATDAPVDMTIVTADEIKRSGAHDIPGVLRHVAGVDVAQWTNDDADVSIRGYNQPYAPRLLVLIDGRQVYADYYGFTPWSALPIELGAIRQIEIVKGPSAALFGFNAVGGVINIVTYDPQFDDVNSLSASGGTQNLGEGSLILTLHQDDRLSVRATIGGRTDDDFTSPVPAGLPGPSRRKAYRGEIGINSVYRVSQDIQLRLEASHSVAAQNEFYPGYTMDNAVFRTSSVKAELTADTAAGLVTLGTYTNWIAEDVAITQGVPLFFHLTNQVSVTQLSDVFTVGASSTIRIAGEYRHNMAGTVPFPGANVSYDVYSGSAMWAWTITPALSLTNAVRLDDLSLGRSGPVPFGFPFTNADWNRDVTETSFNSGLVWKMDEDDTLRLMASRGVQLPNLVNLGALLYVAQPVSLTGSPFTDPSTVTNYEISWDRALEVLDAKLHGAIFHQETDDVISNAGDQKITQSGFWLLPGRVGSSRADGAEVSLDGTFEGGWRWGLSWRLESVTDDFIPIAQGGIDLVEFEHSTPHQLVNLNLGWSSDHWQIDGYTRYQSRTTGLVPTPMGITMQSPISDYVSLDGRIAYRLDNGVTFAVSAQNFARDRQRQTAGPDVERRVLFTVSSGF